MRILLVLCVLSLCGRVSAETCNSGSNVAFTYVYQAGTETETYSQGYTCPNTPGRDTTGNGGNFNNYCIFDTLLGAQNQCTFDPLCGGYLVITPTPTTTPYYQLYAANGPTLTPTYSPTQQVFVKQLPYVQTFLSESDSSTSHYTCPDATGRDATGNNGNFNNFCIFDRASDAVAQCSNDINCAGYLNQTLPNNLNYFQLFSTSATLGTPTSNQQVWLKPVSYEVTAVSVADPANSPRYLCNSAPNRDVTGNSGDFYNYCIFDTASAAAAYCSTDIHCVGYVSPNPNVIYYQLFGATTIQTPSTTTIQKVWIKNSVCANGAGAANPKNNAGQGHRITTVSISVILVSAVAALTM